MRNRFALQYNTTWIARFNRLALRIDANSMGRYAAMVERFSETVLWNNWPTSNGCHGAKRFRKTVLQSCQCNIKLGVKNLRILSTSDFRHGKCRIAYQRSCANIASTAAKYLPAVIDRGAAKSTCRQVNWFCPPRIRMTVFPARSWWVRNLPLPRVAV